MLLHASKSNWSKESVEWFKQVPAHLDPSIIKLVPFTSVWKYVAYDSERDFVRSKRICPSKNTNFNMTIPLSFGE